MKSESKNYLKILTTGEFVEIDELPAQCPVCWAMKLERESDPAMGHYFVCAACKKSLDDTRDIEKGVREAIKANVDTEKLAFALIMLLGRKVPTTPEEGNTVAKAVVEDVKGLIKRSGVLRLVEEVTRLITKGK